MIRMAEIEIDAAYVDEYMAILKVESEASVRLEPGVICIYPMFQKGDSTEIRLLEIYASKAAYEAHLQTSHFMEYKSSTIKMVKALRLIEMEAIDRESMAVIFKKLSE